MKKEFKSIESITCRFVGLKNNNNLGKVGNLVNLKIRLTELEKLEGDKDYKNILASLDESFSVDADKATDKQLLTVCDNDKDVVELFKAHNELVKQARKAVSAIPATVADFNALKPTDKAFILLEAHKNMQSIVIDVEGDFTKAVNAFFNKGELKQVKDLCRVAMYKSIGTDGEYFYGAKLKKSDFADADIRKAFGGACKGAERKLTNKGKENEKLSNYDWKVTADKKTVDKLVSNLFAVVIESRKDSLQFNEQPKEQPKEEPKK